MKYLILFIISLVAFSCAAPDNSSTDMEVVDQDVIAERWYPDDWVTEYDFPDEPFDIEKVFPDPGFRWCVHKLEDKILEIIASQIAKELNELSEEERQKRIKQLSEEMKNNGIPTKTIKEVEKRLLIAGSLSSATIVNLFTVPVTSYFFYSSLGASLMASAFGLSSTLLVLTGTGLRIATVLPFFAFWLSMPNYKKVIPATLQFIRIRKRLEYIE